MAPAATPAERVARLAAESRAAFADPAIRARLETAGFEAIGSSPEEARRFLLEETERWGGMIRRLGIRADG